MRPSTTRKIAAPITKTMSSRFRVAWPWVVAASGGIAVRTLKSVQAERTMASAPRAAIIPARRAHLFAVRPMGCVRPRARVGGAPSGRVRWPLPRLARAPGIAEVPRRGMIPEAIVKMRRCARVAEGVPAPGTPDPRRVAIRAGSRHNRARDRSGSAPLPNGRTPPRRPAHDRPGAGRRSASRAVGRDGRARDPGRRPGGGGARGHRAGRAGRRHLRARLVVRPDDLAAARRVRRRVPVGRPAGRRGAPGQPGSPRPACILPARARRDRGGTPVGHRALRHHPLLGPHGPARDPDLPGRAGHRALRTDHARAGPCGPRRGWCRSARCPTGVPPRSRRARAGRMQAGRGEPGWPGAPRRPAGRPTGTRRRTRRAAARSSGRTTSRARRWRRPARPARCPRAPPPPGRRPGSRARPARPTARDAERRPAPGRSWAGRRGGVRPLGSGADPGRSRARLWREPARIATLRGSGVPGAGTPSATRAHLRIFTIASGIMPRLGTSAIPGARARRGRGHRTRPDGAPPTRARGRTHPMGLTAKRWARRAGMIAALGALAIVLSACTDFNVRTAMPPDAATTQGQATRNLYDIVFVIGAAIFLVVEGLILFAVLRYRRRKGDDELPPQIHGNNRLEIAVQTISSRLLLALFVLSWQTLNTVDAHTPTPTVRIGVVAYQWQWQFVYAPDGVNWQDCGAAANKGKCVTVIGTIPAGGDRANWTPPTMHVPVNETVELQMHSIDVIHSFYVPAFLYQRDITPRRDQVIQFTADKVGIYRGQCTQFCGLYHQFMEFQVQVEPRADYVAWLQQQLTPPPSPSPAPAASAGAPAGSPGGSPAAAGSVSLALTAQGVAYDTTDLAAPANTPFQIVFTNNDAGIPHNVSIHVGSPTGQEVFKGEIFAGPDSRTYAVPALPAGTYAFVCSVHPNMTGTLTVK